MKPKYERIIASVHISILKDLKITIDISKGWDRDSSDQGSNS